MPPPYVLGCIVKLQVESSVVLVGGALHVKQNMVVVICSVVGPEECEHPPRGVLGDVQCETISRRAFPAILSRGRQEI